MLSRSCRTCFSHRPASAAVTLLRMQAGKAMGDKRAVTAERAFYRPFQKVVVATSGVEQ